AIDIGAGTEGLVGAEQGGAHVRGDQRRDVGRIGAATANDHYGVVGCVRELDVGYRQRGGGDAAVMGAVGQREGGAGSCPAVAVPLIAERTGARGGDREEGGRVLAVALVVR